MQKPTHWTAFAGWAAHWRRASGAIRGGRVLISLAAGMSLGRLSRWHGRATLRQHLNQRKDSDMDKDRIAGAAKQAKGAIKEAAGKALGDI